MERFSEFDFIITVHINRGKVTGISFVVRDKFRLINHPITIAIHFLKEWADYFPHVDEAQLRGNYHKKLDALQGKRRTVMVGEVFNLPLVSECVDWARYVVRREFPRVAEASA